jgi:K+-transporting ATPase KdpF subunit
LRGKGTPMTEPLIMLVIVIFLLGYLVFALLRPEKF